MTLKFYRNLLYLLVPMLLSVSAPGRSAESPPPNHWQPVWQGKGGPLVAGLVYVPHLQGMLQFGYGQPQGERSDLLLYRPREGHWEEPLPGRGNHRKRGTLTTIIDQQGRPGLPWPNRPYWMGHQGVYVPPLERVLYFAGGMTLTYDPATRRWENLDIPLDRSPPDVMLGSLAWDPVGQRVILFGGGYLNAYKRNSERLEESQVRGQAWTLQQWTAAEKRATWAFDPKTRVWSRVETGTPALRADYQQVTALRSRLETLMGDVRGVALEYRETDPGQLAATIGDLAREVADLEVERQGDYAEARQQARTLLVEASRGLQEAAAALAEEADGWQTLHGLEKVKWNLFEAAEAIAPNPPPRYYGALVTDSSNERLILFGGHGGDKMLGDTWIFDPHRNQWHRSRSRAHPPPNARPAMSFDDKRGVALLLPGWLYDARRDHWQQVSLESPKGNYFSSWTALAYDPQQDIHVAVTSGYSLNQPTVQRVAHLRLDATAAVTAEPGEPLWTWLDDKYRRAWEALPRTQSDYQALVERQSVFLANLQPNTWTALKAPAYNAQARAYGTFTLDWSREQLVYWGGGHSAYMGNEVSHYDIKSNLWLESWPPDFPPWPFGSPDGGPWEPALFHRRGSAHGYHNYVYNADLDKIIFWNGRDIYDPDRMDWTDLSFEKIDRGSAGIAVAMSGAEGFFSASDRHWRGGPFGVWEADFERMILRMRPGSTPPFSANDRAKPVYDSRRERILWYGVSDSPRELFAYDLAQGQWQKLLFDIEPADHKAPPMRNWSVTYSHRHDVLMIIARGTWLYHPEDNRLRRLGPAPKTGQGVRGLVYDAQRDVFIAMERGSYGVGPVRLHFLRLQQ